MMPLSCEVEFSTACREHSSFAVLLNYRPLAVNILFSCVQFYLSASYQNPSCVALTQTTLKCAGHTGFGQYALENAI